MATPADQRLLELLNLWLRSLELHLKYTSLDDASYAKIRAWPAHQRPGRWILDLAKQKTFALKAQVEERMKTGDAKFAEALENMIFLANLVGLQHIERFIPLAQEERDGHPALVPADPASMTSTSPQVLPPPKRESPAHGSGATATREMPQFPGARQKPARTTSRTAAKAAGKPPATAPVVRTGAATPGPVETEKPADALSATDPAAASPAVSPREQVLADAERLLQWGRKWYELAELIARMADRPPLPEVRRILKEHKAALDKSDGA
jgi:hypothetical protein